MSSPAYLEPRMEITEFMCILNVVRSAVFVVTIPTYSIQFIHTVRGTIIRNSFWGRISNTMRDYVTVCPTGVLLYVTKLIVLVPFCTLPGNTLASFPNSFVGPFFQMSRVFSFDFMKSLYCSIYPCV